ncbi:hypothetical protein B0O99DRAFT_594218 [Bisporella sp. PMI_857]|nr:hypothetical protein B0O99DRAFT_594218 [Bisporella sp. PMI_857]
MCLIDSSLMHQSFSETKIPPTTPAFWPIELVRSGHIAPVCGRTESHRIHLTTRERGVEASFPEHLHALTRSLIGRMLCSVVPPCLDEIRCSHKPNKHGNDHGADEPKITCEIRSRLPARRKTSETCFQVVPTPGPWPPNHLYSSLDSRHFWSRRLGLSLSLACKA